MPLSVIYMYIYTHPGTMNDVQITFLDFICTALCTEVAVHNADLIQVSN